MPTQLLLCSSMDASRPVMTREQLVSLGRQLLQMSTLDVNVRIAHVSRTVTRFSDNRILSSDDGSTVRVTVELSLGESPTYWFTTNQIDENTFRTGIQQCETALRSHPEFTEALWRNPSPLVQDIPITVNLWHDATVAAMSDTRSMTLPRIFETVHRHGLDAAGFLGIQARAEALILKEGDVMFFNEETDSELNVSAMSREGRSIGWSGAASRDWSTVDVPAVTEHAIRMARLGMNAVAMEPGRRTAILTPTAVAQLTRFFAWQWDAGETNRGMTALSQSRRGGNKLRQRIFDRRVTMSSDPADVTGGYRPFFDRGVATPRMTWVNDGTLQALAYSLVSSQDAGIPYTDFPISLRLSGGTTSIDDMIAQCSEGIFVNRFSDLELVDPHSCLLTGVTQGGCFFVKHGKITKGVKNFRFLDSPFFAFNKIVALGPSVRAAFGATPIANNGERPWDPFFWPSGWPRLPMIVPPMMVHDFNFSALSDAV
jgi:predicted Zn-dependent protease